MFRDDKCTIKRPTSTKVQGEVVYGNPTAIYTDIPCHLSRNSLASLNQSQSTAMLNYSYVLFTELGVEIQPNDIVEVTTYQGQYFELRAGQSKRYALSTQTQCEAVKIV